jgi:hypothetical protein
MSTAVPGGGRSWPARVEPELPEAVKRVFDSPDRDPLASYAPLYASGSRQVYAERLAGTSGLVAAEEAC